MLVCIGEGTWPMISLRCSDLQALHWEIVNQRGVGPALRRFNSFTAIKGPEGGVAAEVVVLIGGVEEATEARALTSISSMIRININKSYSLYILLYYRLRWLTCGFLQWWRRPFKQESLCNGSRYQPPAHCH